MKVKKNDMVKVLSGKDRGKTGKIIQVLRQPAIDKVFVVVEGVNLRKKHLRGSGKERKGQTIELSAPLHMSKVMVVDPKTNKPTRIGYRVEGTSKKRIAKKSGEFLDI